MILAMIMGSEGDDLALVRERLLDHQLNVLDVSLSVDALETTATVALRTELGDLDDGALDERLLDALAGRDVGNVVTLTTELLQGEDLRQSESETIGETELAHGIDGVDGVGYVMESDRVL